MRIKDIILTAVCISSFLVANGQESKKCLVLLKNDDSTVYFPLENEPKINFVETAGIYCEMIIESDNDQYFFSLPEQNKLELYEVSGVDIIDGCGNTEMNIIGKEIIIKSAIDDIQYSVVNLDGKKIIAGELPIGLSTVSLSSLQSGIYIISVGKKSLKIRIK